MSIARMKALAEEWKQENPYTPSKADFWPALEKAARTWAISKGIDPDAFVNWLRKKAREPEPVTMTQPPKRVTTTHAAATAPED